MSLPEVLAGPLLRRAEPGRVLLGGDVAARRPPGDHQGFATHPGPFAEAVHRALRGG